MNQPKIILSLCNILLFILLNSCGISANKPETMFRKAGLKIDDYEIVSKSDNLERDSSAWDSYDYIIKIKGDPKNLEQQLNNLVKTNSDWNYENGRYMFIKDEDDYYLVIYVYIKDSEINIEYSEYSIYS